MTNTNINNRSGFIIFNIERVFHSAIIFLLLFFTPGILFAQVQPGSLMFDGNLRNYLVFLPQSYGGGLDFPVVINLHGDTRSAQWQMDYTLMNSLADTAGVIVVYPNAFYFNTGGWLSFNHDNITVPIIPNEPDTLDVGFINVLIDTLMNNYSIDPDRIYACGWSGGGYMSFKLACQLNHRIAAIASVTPEFSDTTAGACAANRAMPVLLIYGTADPLIPYGGAPGYHSTEQTVSHWVNLNNCLDPDTTLLPDLDPNDGCTVEKITYPNGIGGSKVIFYKVIGGGHTWPGAAFGLPGCCGNTNYDINANVEIWNFLKNYRLSQFPPMAIASGQDAETPYEYRLFSNYPNPFNPTTTISYSLFSASKVELKIYNALGQEIRMLVNARQPTGTHRVEWDGRDDNGNLAASGLYFYQLRAGSFVETRKMILIR